MSISTSNITTHHRNDGSNTSSSSNFFSVYYIQLTIIYLDYAYGHHNPLPTSPQPPHWLIYFQVTRLSLSPWSALITPLPRSTAVPTTEVYTMSSTSVSVSALSTVPGQFDSTSILGPDIYGSWSRHWGGRCRKQGARTYLLIYIVRSRHHILNNLPALLAPATTEWVPVNEKEKALPVGWDAIDVDSIVE